MKITPIDYLTLGNTRMAATGVAAVFGISGTGKTSRAVLPILKQFGERLACAAPAMYLSANSSDLAYDVGQVMVMAPRAERGGPKEDTEWQNVALQALTQFAQSTEVYRALAIDAEILRFLGIDGVESLIAAINSASGSVSKFILVTAPSVNVLPPAVRLALEKLSNTRVFFTIVDIDTMELVRTTLFPRRFWLPRRAYPRDLRTAAGYADAIIETEIGKDKESRLTRLTGTVKHPRPGDVAAHVERFAK
jgi:hypothetical protein